MRHFSPALAYTLAAAMIVSNLWAESAEVRPVRKILFLGNSITQHSPSKPIGWLSDWGMAASAAEKDFVHIVTRRLSAEGESRPEVMVRSIARFEREYATYDLQKNLKDCFAFGADLVIVAIGENVAALKTDASSAQFSESVRKLLKGLQSHSRPTIVVRSCFWSNPAKDRILEECCREVDGVFVDISHLDKNESNYARSERQFAHKGVANHPGDRGMQAIADAILNAIDARQGRRASPTESRRYDSPTRP